MKSLLSRSAFLFLSLCGLAHGQDEDSLPPVVVSPATTQGIISMSVLADQVLFIGTVNPNGSPTTAQFEFGLSSSYGNVLPVTMESPNADTVQNVTAEAAGLAPSTIYHYRLTATNAHGTSSTPDKTFRTKDYPYHVNHLAGSRGGSGISDGLGRAAKFAYPLGIASAPGGHFYLVDNGANTIRKVTAEGMVTTFAGSAGVAGSADGAGQSALFFRPTEVAVDSAGNLYVTDTRNHTIRRISSAGVVTTLAGTAGMSGAVDGSGGEARFSNPEGIAVDATGNVYVSDNQMIRKITSSGVVTTLAGLAGVSGNGDGPGGSARFNSPAGLAMAADGSLLVADRWNHAIRRINTTTGTVSTLAGFLGSLGNDDGIGSLARFSFPSRLAVDADGITYVPSSTGIRRITAAGVVSTVNGAGTDFVGLLDIATGPVGELIFIRSLLEGPGVFRRDNTGVIRLLAGNPAEPGSIDGPSETARFYAPAGVVMDASGSFYVADRLNSTIRKISSTGIVTTFAGTPRVAGHIDGVGSAARFINSVDLAMDSGGNVFVGASDSVRKITPAGSVSTLAMLVNESNRRICVDGNGDVLVTTGHSIQKITSGGLVSTFAGQASLAGSQDGAGTTARFNSPRGLAVDAAGDVYVADSSNHTIRKITPSGVVTTHAGIVGESGSDDGPSSSARFSSPDRLCLDQSGNLFVSFSFVIRRVSPSGDVSSFMFVDMDTPSSIRSPIYPSGLLCTPDGSLVLVDAAGHKVQRFTPGPLIGRISASGLNTTSARLNARLAPNAPTTTTALFEYGTSSSYGSAASVTLSPDSGSAEQSVSASLSGLLPATTYHYRLTATNARGTNTTSNGIFTTLNMQQGWRQTYFGSSANEGNAADTFDHDGDGIVNLLEWATGLNPTTNSTLPASSTVSGTDIEYHYTRLVAAIAAGAVFTVEWNDTLSPLGWSSAGVVETILSNNGTTQQVKATLPAGSNGKRFVRLRVTGAP